MTSDRLLTRVEAAAIVRMHPNSLDRLCAKGQGPKRIKLGEAGSRGVVRYDREELEKWLTSRTT